MQIRKVGRAAAAPADNGSMVRCGIAGWVDKELIGSRKFYPPGVTSSEERLHFYASRFSLVEVDSTYHGMPAKRNSELWIARTSPSFRFDVKSFSLFTHHPTSPRTLLPEIRAQLAKDLAEKKSLYLDKLPPEVVDAAWEAFRDALEPHARRRALEVPGPGVAAVEADHRELRRGGLVHRGHAGVEALRSVHRHERDVPGAEEGERALRVLVVEPGPLAELDGHLKAVHPLLALLEVGERAGRREEPGRELEEDRTQPAG